MITAIDTLDNVLDRNHGTVDTDVKFFKDVLEEVNDRARVSISRKANPDGTFTYCSVTTFTVRG